MATPRRRAEATLARLHDVRVGLLDVQLAARDFVRRSNDPDAAAAWRRLRVQIVDLMRVVDDEARRLNEILDAAEPRRMPWE